MIPGSLAVMSAAATSSFTPLSLFGPSDVGGWWDFKDFSTIFQDTAATTPVTGAQAVARVNDKSGKGNHATQSTVANQPVMQQDAASVWRCRFDNTNDALNFPSITSSAGMTMLISGVIFSAPSAAQIYDGRAFVSSYLAGFVRDVSIGVRNNGSSTTASAYAELGSTNVEVRGDAYTTGVKAVFFADSNSTQTRVSTNFGTLYSGGGSRNDLLVDRMGPNQSSGQPAMDGAIYEAIVIGRVLSPSERLAAINYLAAAAQIAV